MAQWKPMIKKTAIAAMATTMLLGSATAAFADGKGRGHGKYDDGNKNGFGSQFESQFESQFKNGLPPGIAKKVQIKITFEDVKLEADWAMRYIASLASKRVFEGYEDGTFKPRKAITRIEALTAAVRLMGLRAEAESSEAMNSNLNFRDADKIRQKYPWAVGYVAVALENDLFLESDSAVMPEKEADRLWATMLLIKALKLEDEAKAKMNTKLGFKDAGQIPAGAVGYVALAVEKGLIDGYEDNTFRPNRPVTRAELAALLDRTGNQMPDYNNTTASGTISAAVNGDVLTMVTDGQTKQFALDDDAFILRKGVKVEADDLEVGDEVKVYVYNNLVTFIEVTKAVEEQTPVTQIKDGTLTDIDNDELTYTKNGQTATVDIDADTRIYRNGALVDEDDLKIGDEIKIYTHNNIVLFIEVTRPVDPDNSGDFTIDGKFYGLSIDADGEIATISITTSVYGGNQLRVYNVDDDVDIIGDAALLQPDRNVQLRGEDNIVTTIEIK